MSSRAVPITLTTVEGGDSTYPDGSRWVLEVWPKADKGGPVVVDIPLKADIGGTVVVDAVVLVNDDSAILRVLQRTQGNEVD